MPGISLVVSSSLNQQAISYALDDFKSDYSFSPEILYKDDYSAIIFSGHEDYPKWFYENDEYIVLLEGIVYNQDVNETTKELLAIANIFSVTGNAKERINDFVNNSDGDYLCLVYLKRSLLCLLFNDRFGRLPTFYCKGESFFAVSREIKFLLHFMPEITIDRLGMAHFLMFEHNIGDKTLIKNIRRLLPSHVLQAHFETSRLSAKIKVANNVSVPLNFD